MRSSPRLRPELIHAVRHMDVDVMSVAEVWRQSGAVAERLGLPRPGYHRVLALVRDERRRRADRRAAIAEAVGEIWAVNGTDYAQLARRLSETRRS